MDSISSNTCYTCKCSFTRKQHYERHLTSHKHVKNTISANKNQNHVCLQCNIPFKTEKSLQSHFSTKRHLSKIIKTSNDDYGFNDRPLVALLTKTIQEHEARIVKLEKLVESLLDK
jgi:hypothetical protein